MKNVYLSGGTVTHWQNLVMDYFNNVLHKELVSFYDPSTFRLGSLDRPECRLYSPMDRIKIEECDILFAYLEASNPTPINVALEIGYAKGLGKMVILCNEWTPEKFEAKQLKTMDTNDPAKKAIATWFKPHYVDLLCSWADFVEPDFGIAKELLRMMVEYGE